MTRFGISDRERTTLFSRLLLGSAPAKKVSAETTPLIKPARSAGPGRRPHWKLHLQKIALIASFLVVSNRIVLTMIGALNRKPFLIGTVFLAYPGSDDILRTYCYGRLREWASWRPTLIGAYNQEGSWGLMFAVASTEKDFERPENAKRLKELYGRMVSIAGAIRAREVRFAGVLPSKFHAHGVTRGESEVEAAVAALLQAEAIVRSREQIGESAPVIILGANGFVGRRLTSRLARRNVYPVDVGPLGAGMANSDSWPAQLSGQRALLINVASSETLALYLGLLWNSLVVLNEVYPAPSRQVLERLSARNCRCYHLAGAVGDAYPDFPWPYAGAVPCCAARIGDETRLVVKRLV